MIFSWLFSFCRYIYKCKTSFSFTLILLFEMELYDKLRTVKRDSQNHLQNAGGNDMSPMLAEAIIGVVVAVLHEVLDDKSVIQP